MRLDIWRQALAKDANLDSSAGRTCGLDGMLLQWPDCGKLERFGVGIVGYV